MEIFYNILCPVKKVPVQRTRSHIHLLGECGPLLWVLPWSSLLLLLESTLGDDGGKGGTNCNIILLPSLNPPEELDPITMPLWRGETCFWLAKFTLRDVVRVGSFIISFTIMLTSLQSDPGLCLLRPPRDSGGFAASLPWLHKWTKLNCHNFYLNIFVHVSIEILMLENLEWKQLTQSIAIMVLLVRVALDHNLCRLTPFPHHSKYLEPPHNLN